MSKIFRVLSILGHVIGTALTISLFAISNDEHVSCLLGLFTFTVLVEGSQFDAYLEDMMLYHQWSFWESVKDYDWNTTFWNVTQNTAGVLLYLI